MKVGLVPTRHEDLIIGGWYLAGEGLAGEPISKLLPVGNRGGIRYGGNLKSPNYLVLFSTFSESDWPDKVVSRSLTYWGDNRNHVQDLHGTPKKGNEILRNIFHAAWEPSQRWTIPLSVLFAHRAGSRDVDCLGVLVPGVPNSSADEDLVAVWRRSEGGWFQNYKARFTILPTKRVERRFIDLWPSLTLQERCSAVEGFAEWLEAGR